MEFEFILVFKYQVYFNLMAIKMKMNKIENELHFSSNNKNG